METTKPYSKRENTYFENIGFIKKFFQAFVTQIPNYVATKVEKIHKRFLWANSTPKIKDNILCNDYKDGGLKNVDIQKKSTSLQFHR